MHFMATAELTGGQKFAAYRERLGLSHRRAAALIGCSHTSIIAWESGRITPLPPFRDRIAAWSKGELEASIWHSSREDEAERKIAEAVKLRSKRASGASLRRAG